ncbi:MAG TPA: helix-turn-helix domain-containing protein, partial [Vicinamibacterales bacterium]|nr:helix-turn-helix domain-containing protein [Vicinamibacterales bacterium]
MFLQYEWPGNIRELENMIKRVVILQDEHLVLREIERNMQRVAATAAAVPVPAYAVAGFMPAGMVPGGLMPSVPAPVDSDVDTLVDDVEPVDDATGGASLAAVAKAASMKAERAAIEQTLLQVHWNRRKAAQILGVSYKTLLNKIKECGIIRA